ncbi:hypothetical protein ABPG72_006740 [Tetrahymena utriculariae]
MSTSNQVKQEVENKIQNCTIKKQSVRRFFKYMGSQQKDYQILEFAGNGAFSLVLKALNKKTGQTVALKVTECDENDYEGMEIVEKEYKTLSVFSGCKHIVKVLNCFYLTEGDDGDDDQIPDNQNGCNSEQLKSDVFSTGIVLLELDNIASFDFSKTNPEWKYDIKQGNIFPSFNLDRQSQVYKIVQQCIQYEINQRKNAIELLIQFIAQNQQYLNVEIFSVINKNQLTQKSEQLSQLQKSIIEKKKQNESQILQLSQIFNKDLHIKQLIDKFNQLNSKPFETKQYEIILNKLQAISRFDPNFEFISVGATGLVLGVFNKTQNRHSVLKIQMAQKHKIIHEVGIMRDCQMPLVIKLYDYFYIDINPNDSFVVYEIEKCHGNLKQYLQNLQKQKKELDEQQKIKIAIQIMDVINYLHLNEIVHRDIKLENFLYIEQDSDIPIIKLADFDQARKVPYYWLNYEKQFYSIEGACGTIGYSSPELMKDYLYTFKVQQIFQNQNLIQHNYQSDIFSVGVCLALIDNFETLEPVLFQKAFDYFNNFSTPFQINSSVQYEVVKRNTQIYEFIQKTVVFNQHKRSNLSTILSNLLKQRYKYYSNLIEQTQEIQSNSQYQRIISLDYSRNYIRDKGLKDFAPSLSSFNNLQSLTLKLGFNNIGNDGALALGYGLQHTSNLSILVLYLGNNQFDDLSEQKLRNMVLKIKRLVREISFF